MERFGFATASLEQRINTLKVDKVMTKEGKRIAQLRHKFMENFFNTLWLEIEGKK